MLIVADIRDQARMFEIFERYRPEVVFHAAALKHLTLLENHPAEGVKTNALGTKNLLDAAVHTNVERFVNVSTDKAADPTSVLGATKLAAEKLTAQVRAETGAPSSRSGSATCSEVGARSCRRSCARSSKASRSPSPTPTSPATS